ncbi:MAG TPA: fluoride efflux transporter CrcB [Acidimicrobiales bacterium]|jgi:CrcB protein|nr:fluoride efflux transporter CrcB [Acidimicrobiales bacterium]
MSAWLWLAIAVAGAIGAPLRYMIDGAVSGRARSTFPMGTFVVNMSGSFVLGLITGLVLYHAFPADGRLVIGLGLIGAYTTFSTFTFEAASLIERREVRLAALNIGGSVVVGAAAAAAGLALAAI